MRRLSPLRVCGTSLAGQVRVPVLIFALTTALLCASCGGSRDGAGSPGSTHANEPFDNLVLITIDTLRADRLGCYGYPRAVSPFLDSLAAQGVRFERVLASSSNTGPSHASMFTAQYPARHRVLRNGHKLRPAVPTLAGLLAERDFTTAGFAAMGFLKTVASGFETFDSKRGLPYRPAEEMVDRAIDWSTRRESGQRFFLWVHFYDVHNSEADWGIPEPEFADMQRDSADRWAELSRVWVDEQGLPGEELDRYRSRYDHYDAQIKRVDRELARLFEHILADTPGERTLWVITSDHGEGLGAHGFFGHSMHIYEEQLRVPLIFFAEDRWPAGSTVEQMVRHVDLLPTLTELLGVEIDSEAMTLEGRSLVPLLRDPNAEVEIDVAIAQRRPADEDRRESGWVPGLVLAARTERYKYIWKSAGEDELYDLREDPFELENLVGQGLEVEPQLSDWLSRKYRWMRENQLVGVPWEPEIETEHVEELKALGYIQ